jgi:hypothetical protein
MTALIFSLVLLAYVIIPGVAFRRIFHFFVPLRRIQWSRTDELTAFVATLIVPAAAAILLVRNSQFFGHHPYGFPDSSALKWNDYKDIFAASYSEKFFEANRLQLIDDLERVSHRQGHFLVWYYIATLLWAVLCGSLAYYYGNIRNYSGFVGKALTRFLEKLAIPVISEWHAMFTPYTFSHSPKRWVQVDALSTDGILYQGEAGLFHVGNDGQLNGFFLKGAKRFLRAEYAEAKKTNKETPKDKFWRDIPGESFFLPADKISNFNFTYIPAEALDTLAEENLKKMKIDATVMIQKATVAVEPPTAKPEQTGEEPKPPGAHRSTVDAALQLGMQKNFAVCQHCLLNGKPGRLPRVSADTPLVSRSDGRSYHLFLLFGPKPQPSISGASIPGRYLAHFRYTLDSKNLANEPVTVLIEAKLQPLRSVRERVEMAADRIADTLEKGERPARFYKLAGNKFTELKPTPSI